MLITNLLLGALVLIEFMNLCVRVIKLVPPQDPPLDEEIRIKLYS